tara:strand:- start:3975 stop:4421 length:447 start_codon:yes stop_codon:yes gene_type:complete
MDIWSDLMADGIWSFNGWTLIIRDTVLSCHIKLLRQSIGAVIPSSANPRPREPEKPTQHGWRMEQSQKHLDRGTEVMLNQKQEFSSEAVMTGTVQFVADSNEDAVRIMLTMEGTSHLHALLAFDGELIKITNVSLEFTQEDRKGTEKE